MRHEGIKGLVKGYIWFTYLTFSKRLYVIFVMNLMSLKMNDGRKGNRHLSFPPANLRTFTSLNRHIHRENTKLIGHMIHSNAFSLAKYAWIWSYIVLYGSRKHFNHSSLKNTISLCHDLSLYENLSEFSLWSVYEGTVLSVRTYVYLRRHSALGQELCIFTKAQCSLSGPMYIYEGTVLSVRTYVYLWRHSALGQDLCIFMKAQCSLYFRTYVYLWRHSALGQDLCIFMKAQCSLYVRTYV